MENLWRKKLRGFFHAVLPWDCHVCGRDLVCDGELSWGICGGCRASLPRMQAPQCRICGLGLSSEDGICLSCREFGTALPGIRLMRSAFLYTGTGPDVLHAYKVGGGSCLSRMWAEALLPRIREVWEDGMYLVGIPSLRRNIRRRGFDQVSAFLSKLPEPYRSQWLPDLLRRQGGVAQKSLSRSERATNLEGAIGVQMGRPVPRQVLLVDDVCTTGATLSLCAQILRSEGCEDVCALTIFRD